MSANVMQQLVSCTLHASMAMLGRMQEVHAQLLPFTGQNNDQSFDFSRKRVLLLHADCPVQPPLSSKFALAS